MAFLAPLAGLLALLAIPIILLYMLRLRRREVEVSSTFLWAQIVQDREANAPWQRLRRNLLLILQLIILAALIIALMRPFIETPVITTGRITVLLDASASMNATDVTPTRFDAAKQAALDIAGTLGAQDTMTVIRVAERPEVLANATHDINELRQAISSAGPSLGAANWSAALTLAAGGGSGVENYSVVIIGDGGLPADAPSIQADVRYVPIGTSGENVAITALAVRARAGEGPQLFAEIRNFGDQDAEVIFTTYLDGDLVPGTRYTVPAGGAQGVTLADLPQNFTVLRASLTPAAGSGVPDHLVSDDQAWTVYNPGGAGTVLLMTPGNLFLQQILASMPGIQARQARIEGGLPQTPFDLYIFDGWLPDALPDGDLLIIDPPQDSALFTIAGRSDQSLRADIPRRVAENDPRTLYLNFDNVSILDFKVLEGIDWADPLVWMPAGPLLLAGEVDGRQVAILTFDLHRSNLQLNIAWPILMSNLMQWYTPARAINAPGGLQVGETLVIAPPFEADTIRVTRPDGSVQTFNADDLQQPQVIFADTAQPGIYTVDTYSGGDLLQSEPFAVNLFDWGESAIAPAAALTIGTATVAEAEAEEIGQMEFWPWLALAALAVLGLEWYVYHRGARLPQVRRLDMQQLQRDAARRVHRSQRGGRAARR